MLLDCAVFRKPGHLVTLAEIKHHGRAADNVVPEKADAGPQEEKQDQRLGKQGSEKTPRFLHPPQEEPHRENTQYRAVKERAENIDRLDKVVEQRSEGGEEQGQDAPACGEPARGTDVVRVAGVLTQAASVEIDDRGRRQRR